MTYCQKKARIKIAISLLGMITIIWTTWYIIYALPHDSWVIVPLLTTVGILLSLLLFVIGIYLDAM